MKTFIQIFLLVVFLIGQSFAQDISFKKRYVNHTEFGGLFGRVNYENAYNGGIEGVENKLSLTIQMYNGVKLTDQLSTGLTVAMDWYKTALINPVAVGARYDITRGKVARLYATADVGYGFAWFHDDMEGYKTEGGLMINPGLGLRYGKPGSVSVTLALTYKRQNVSVSKPPLWEQTERNEDRIYNRMGLRLGMSF